MVDEHLGGLQSTGGKHGWRVQGEEERDGERGEERRTQTRKAKTVYYHWVNVLPCERVRNADSENMYWPVGSSALQCSGQG